MKNRYFSIFISGFLGCFVTSITSASPNLKSMTDTELSTVTGQALMSLTYTSPSDVSNLETHRNGGNTQMGFYKLGMEAEVAINVNIKKLQLGCGGVNGAGDCDIDIDNLSLSGLKLNSSGSVNMTNIDRASSDAILTNPFIEFAIKNPNTASTREVAGFRLSAEKILGLLTAGTNNDTPNGINSLSGFMQINGYGTAKTAQSTFGLKNNEQVNSVANVDIALCTKGCSPNAPYTAGNVNSNNKGIIIPSMDAPFSITNAVVSGNRMKSANVLAVTDIPAITLSENNGQLGVHMQNQICVAFLICLQDTFIKLNTRLTGLKGDINFSENLGYIHNLPISSSGYLALQSGELQWPGAKEVAQKGWWLSMQDPIDLGQLNPKDPVDISGVYSQVASILGTYLAQNPYKVSVTTGDGLKALVGAGITKTVPDIDLTGNRVSIPLSNVIISSQNITPNCYGSLKFC